MYQYLQYKITTFSQHHYQWIGLHNNTPHFNSHFPHGKLCYPPSLKYSSIYVPDICILSANTEMFQSFVNIQASGVFTTGLLGPCQPLGHRLKTQQMKNFTQCQIVKFVSIFYEYACKIALIRSLFQPKCSKYRSAAGPTGVPRPSWIKSPTSKGKEKDGGRGGKGKAGGRKIVKSVNPPTAGTAQGCQHNSSPHPTPPYLRKGWASASSVKQIISFPLHILLPPRRLQCLSNTTSKPLTCQTCGYFSWTCMRNCSLRSFLAETITTTRTILLLSGFYLGLPGGAGTRKVKPKPIWIYWSKRQWVALASAGPYANLHLDPDT